MGNVHQYQLDVKKFQSSRRLLGVRRSMLVIVAVCVFFFVSSPYRIYSCLSANHFGNKYHHILVINSEEENGLPRKGMIPPR